MADTAYAAIERALMASDAFAKVVDVGSFFEVTTHDGVVFEVLVERVTPKEADRG